MVAAEGAPDLLAAMLHPPSHADLWGKLQQLSSEEGGRDNASSAALREAVGALAAARSGGMTGPELSNTMWALACLGVQDPPLYASLMEVCAVCWTQIAFADGQNTPCHSVDLVADWVASCRPCTASSTTSP